MNDLELQQALRALGARLDSESRPDLAPGVLARLPELRVRSPRRWRRSAAIACALLLIGAATAVAASDAVRDWLLDRGVDAKPVATLPTTSSIDSPDDLGAGRPVSVSAVASALGRPIPASPQLGPPASVRLRASTNGPAVTIVWASRPGLPAGPGVREVGAILTVVRRSSDNMPQLFGKLLGGQTTVEFTRLADVGDAVWIAGAPHAVRMFDGEDVRFRLAANVLVWSDATHVFRFETALDRVRAKQIATTLVG